MEGKRIQKSDQFFTSQIISVTVLNTIFILGALILKTGVTGTSFEESAGPRLVDEFPHTFSFNSRLGGKLPCRVSSSGSGQKDKIRVEWLSRKSGKDFMPLNPNLTTIREIDGDLIFKPIENWQTQVHSVSYQCRVTNSVGTVVSPQVNVRPLFLPEVLDAPFEIENNDVIVLRGNVARLRCTVPGDLKDFVTVTSWVQDASVNIYPNFQTGKYLMLPNGDLYIFNVDTADSFKTFSCRTSFKLTNQAQLSSPSKIIVREGNGGDNQPLTRPGGGLGDGSGSDMGMRLTRNAGEELFLPCHTGQGTSPPPHYSWFRDRDGILTEVGGRRSGGFSNVDRGPILQLTSVEPSDSGDYICRVNNSVSHFDLRIHLVVYAPLRVQISPGGSQMVDVGRQISFRCLVSGSPVTSIEWVKDGVAIRHDSASINRYKINPREVLTVTSVEAVDAGMFQCFASNDLYTSQDSVQLRLGSILPELTYRFSEQTLQVGPYVSIKCIAVGNPPPQFQWTLDGFSIPENERFLVGQYVTVHDNVISHVNITSVHAEDGGLYSCHATNVMGTVSHSSRLNIYGPPLIRRISTPIKAVSGKNFQISCPVSGYPIEGITWERGGKLLPVNRQQRVYPNGTLIIENIQKETDEGIYTCIAKGRTGLTSSRDLHIQVIVPPKIMPFQFLSEYLREGRRLAVSCQILEGDKPLEFTWLFEGKVISPSISAGVTVRIPDEYSSTLVIDSLTSGHNGQWTCMAENAAGKELHSALLTVNVPAKWILEPRDINVAAGQLITLQCQAEGHPTPSITWKRASSSQPGEYKDVIGKSTIVYENGTIRFDEVKKADEGQYLCEAKNQVGSGLSKVIMLKVNAPAEFLVREEEISVKAGDKAVLQCRATGDGPIEIQWFHGTKHSKIVGHSTNRYTVRYQNLDDGMLSELLISGAGRPDSGAYKCRASNSFGSDQTTVTLKIQEPPEQPLNLRLVEEQSRSIQISWSENFNGNSPLINFIIQRKFPTESWTADADVELAVPATQTTAVIPGLSPWTTYHIRVVAQNGLGFSRPSEIVQVTTEQEAPEGPPQDVQVESLTSTKLRVNWLPPLKSLQHGTILGYYLGYREIGLALSMTDTPASGGSVPTSTNFFSQTFPSSDMHGYHFKTVEVGPGNGGSGTLDNLKKYTRYAVVVQTFNSKGAGPVSSPVIGTTEQDVPSMSPLKIICLGISPQSLQLTWEEPPVEGQHGVIQGYKVMYQIVNLDNDFLEEQEEPEVTVDTKMTTTKSTSLHELRRAWNYSISILAFTSLGDGRESSPIICQTDEDVPTAPMAIKAAVSSRRSVLLSWLPPREPNGKLESFTVYMRSLFDDSKIEKRRLDGDDKSYEAIGLTEGQLYEFWVTSSTKIGEGPGSEKVQLSPSHKVPAKIASFSQIIQVPWKREILLRCDSVGLPQPNVLWTFNGKNYADSSFTNSEQSKMGSGVETLKLGQVTPEQGGNYSCTVTNALGTDTITYQVKVLVPPLVKLESMETSFDSLQLSWSILNEATPKGFVINYKKDPGGDWEEFKLNNGRLLVHNLVGLVCGSKYQIFVTAFNKIGTGKPSEIFGGKTKGSVPIPPKKENFVLTNSTAIIINLDNWQDLNCPIHRFHIEYKPSIENQWQLVTADLGSDRTKVIGNLSPSTKYDLHITAHNNAGHSRGDYTVLTTPGHLVGGMPDTDVVDDSSSSHQMNTSLLIVFPSILSLIAITGVIAVLCYFRRKRLGGGPKTVIGQSPGLQMFMQRENRSSSEQHYCVVKTTSNDPSLHVHLDPGRYKTIESTGDYNDDVCPYATFQLPDKAPSRPLITKGLIGGGVGGQLFGPGNTGTTSSKKMGRHTGDTMHYNFGNIYSGPYHSVQSPFIYNCQSTLPLRDGSDEYSKVEGERESENNLNGGGGGSTDSEIKKILTLHLPISSYDTQEDSDDKTKRPSPPIHHTQQLQQQQQRAMAARHHEMVTFRQRSDPAITSDHSSTSSEDSSPGGNGIMAGRKKYFSSRKTKSKSSVQSGSSSMKQRVRSSSGYSSHTEETSFRIQPPSRFSDSRDLSDGGCGGFEGQPMDDMDDPLMTSTIPIDPRLNLPMGGSIKRHKGRGSGTGAKNRKSGGATYHIDV